MPAHQTECLAAHLWPILDAPSLASVIGFFHIGAGMKVQHAIGLVVAVFAVSLPGMYLLNNGTLEWDASDTLASEDKEDRDNPAVDA